MHFVLQKLYILQTLNYLLMKKNYFKKMYNLKQEKRSD